jgi:hypothetical protein
LAAGLAEECKKGREFLESKQQFSFTAMNSKLISCVLKAMIG